MSDYLNCVNTSLGAIAVAGIATAALSYSMAPTPAPLVPCVDVHNQSIEVPNSGGARQSCLVPPGCFAENTYDDAKTILDVMSRGLKMSQDGPCLGWRVQSEYHWLSYSEVIERARNLASGLVNIGMNPGQSSCIGIYAQNCVEWILTEQACYSHSTVTVPLYDTLGPHACSFIINQVNIAIIVCDTEEKIRSVISAANETPSLKQIISFNSFSEKVQKLAEEANIKLHLLKDIEALGKQSPVPINPCKPDDLCTICYTSGTTGNPKGAMLTHANLIIVGISYLLQAGEHGITPSDVMISYLPLAHMFERLCQLVFFFSGASVGFYSGDIKLLLDDMKVLKPTFFPTVPRLANRIYDKVHAQACSSRLKSWILNLALQKKSDEIKKCIIRNNSIWDKFVFQKIRESLGGRIRLISCGGAPLSAEVMTFLRCAMGCLVLEIYGSTESIATITICGDFTTGHVGPPLPCTHMKLVDVPEMNYFAKDSYGEVCIKGPHIFKGYVKDPGKTAETIDAEGWVHTGDIGMWTSNGTLRIIDRKKNIFKLSQGEYIAPEKIEVIYSRSKYVSQIFVHGDSLQSHLVAIIVPEQDTIEPYCKEKNIKGSWKELCQNEIIKKMVLEDIMNEGKKEGLKSFEQVKNIHLHPEQLSIENDLLTPTMKVKRPDCRNYFKQQIEALYKVPLSSPN